MVRQTNLLRERLDAGDVAVGASSVLYRPSVIEAYGAAGLDYAFLDFEHNGTAVWDSLDFEAYTRAAEIADVELVIRLPSGSAETHPPLVRKVVDTGVRNLVIPRVETADEVRAAVEAARFAYDGGPGDRGVGAARGSFWGGHVDDEWLDREDAEVLCGIMVENTTALSDLDDILSVPDLGFVFVGSNDLSVSLGCPLDFDHPDFRDALDTIAEGCVEAGVPFGQIGVGPGRAEEMIEAGGQLLSIGSDLGAIRGGIADAQDAYGV